MTLNRKSSAGSYFRRHGCAGRSWSTTRTHIVSTFFSKRPRRASCSAFLGWAFFRRCARRERNTSVRSLSFSVIRNVRLSSWLNQLWNTSVRPSIKKKNSLGHAAAKKRNVSETRKACSPSARRYSFAVASKAAPASVHGQSEAMARVVHIRRRNTAAAFVMGEW
jgi:hypothetical protein